MSAKTKTLDIGWLIGATVLAFALWAYPVTRPLMLPLVYLNTHIHELCHALAGLATGGRVDQIQVFANGSGVAEIRGSILAVTASAGYIGASVVGGLLIAASRKTKDAQLALMVLGGFMALSMVLFVRGDGVGFVAGVFWAGLLIVLGKKLSGEAAGFATAFLGAQQCLTSVHALLVLYEISSGTDQHSDAQIMAQLSPVPAIVWSVLWMLISAAAMVWGFRIAIRGGISQK